MVNGVPGDFNPRSLRKASTPPPVHCGICGWIFQSTKPTQGFDPVSFLERSTNTISIHEAYARLRLPCHTNSSDSFLFQSTKPTQGFDDELQKAADSGEISIHEAYARLRRRLCRNQSPQADFNPRSLRKASTDCSIPYSGHKIISIHEAYARLRQTGILLSGSQGRFQSTKPTQGFDEDDTREYLSA